MSMEKYYGHWILHIIVFFVFICVLTRAVEDKLTCSFEGDFCQWNNTFSLWERDKYSYRYAAFTGPPDNDVAKDGTYHIRVPPMESNDNNSIAHLQSQHVDIGASSNGRTCFRFWYYMYGQHVQNLTVERGNDNIFQQYGDKGKGWKCGIFDVTGFSGKITFNVYRTLRDYHPYSVIAIDYIQILHSTDCRQDKCESPEAVVPAESSPQVTSTTSTIAPKPSSLPTSAAYINDEPVRDLLPTVIGVPCGVLVVGAVIVSICIYKRRHSEKFLSENRRSQDSNVYSGSPRQSGDGGYNEEVYDTLNENEMIEMNNIHGDTDQPTYHEIDDVKRKHPYVNEAMATPQSHDYLDPVNYDVIPNRNTRPNSEDYLKPEVHKHERPKSEDYLKPECHKRLESADYLRQKHPTNDRPNSEDYLNPVYSENERPNSEDYLRPEVHENHSDNEDYLRPDVHENHSDNEDYLRPEVHENNHIDNEDYLRLQVRPTGRPESHDYLRPDVPTVTKPSDNDYFRIIRQREDIESLVRKETE